MSDKLLKVTPRIYVSIAPQCKKIEKSSNVQKVNYGHHLLNQF